ncbi:hypothetical protein [Silvimonas iriomotensis]|uniref:Uncharacterized protein n=1 Tax=Silvimonas iriomotensis TaxID=449662 RepID=A0ABQ2P5M4_9NEIS|nr:hypothetical protein [Silvimonas iriomotensis]GGP18837.1 hypothetical protein GCM10010970_07640 [Silvimonas iriomotensis]
MTHARTLPRRLLFVAITLLALHSPAFADCKSDNISCVNTCLLPGLAGALTKHDDTAFRSCSDKCDSQLSICLIDEQARQDQERRQQEQAAAAKRAADARQSAAQQARDNAAQAALDARQAAITEKYPGRLAMPLAVLLGNPGTSVRDVADIRQLAVGTVLLKGRFFYVSEADHQVKLLDLVAGTTQSLNIAGVKTLSAIYRDGKPAFPVAMMPGKAPNELAIQVLDSNSTPRSPVIHTGFKAYRDPAKDYTAFSPVFYLAGNQLAVYSYYDADPDVRVFDLTTGNQVTMMSLRGGRGAAVGVVGDHLVVVAAWPGYGQIKAFDLTSNATLFTAPLNVGQVGEQDGLWSSFSNNGRLLSVSWRSNDQKSNRSAWYDASTGKAMCRFDAESSFSEKQGLFASGTRIYSQDCNVVRSFDAAKGGSLYPLGSDHWTVSYPAQEYKQQLLDKDGTPRLDHLVNSVAQLDDGTFLLFEDKQPMRLLSPAGELTTSTVRTASYAIVNDPYFESSWFDDGYRITIGRVDHNVGMAAFMAAQNKDDYETTAQYKSRIASLTTPFSVEGALGRYDADTQILPLTLGKTALQLHMAADDARRLKGQSSATLAGTAKVLEPGVLEIVSATLTAAGVAPLPVQLPKAARSGTNPAPTASTSARQKRKN